MVDAKAFLAWAGIAGFIVVTANMVCGNGLPADNANFIDKLANFFTFGASCTGQAEWVNWMILLVVGGGAIVIVGSIVVPIIAGLAANSIVGTIIAVAGLVTVFGFLASVFI